MFRVLLIVTLLLTACGATFSAASAVCSIPLPNLTESDFQSLTANAAIELDVFFEKFRKACAAL